MFVLYFYTSSSKKAVFALVFPYYIVRESISSKDYSAVAISRRPLFSQQVFLRMPIWGAIPNVTLQVALWSFTTPLHPVTDRV